MSNPPEFLLEAQELLEAFSRQLFAIEGQLGGGEPDPDLLNGAFRSMHTLKGLAGFAGLEDLSSFCHELETTLDALRLGKLRLDSTAIDVLMESLAVCEAQLGIRGEGASADVDPRAVLEKLGRLATVESGEVEVDIDWIDDEILRSLTEFEESRLRQNLRLGRRLYLARASFDLMSFDVGLSAVRTPLEQYGEIISCLPSSGEHGDDQIAMDILLGSTHDLDVLSAAVADQGVIVEPLGGGPSEPEPEPEPESEPESEPEDAELGRQTVLVDLPRLDSLMNVVGELGLVHADLADVLQRIRQTGLVAEHQRELQLHLRVMSRHITTLQQGILDVRMVPMHQVFDFLGRRVQRVCRETEEKDEKVRKEVRLVTAGADTELDKQIVEKLKQALMHLVTNAVDHGIEPPDERVAAGKPRSGRVTIEARPQGSQVVIEMSDDGLGMDWQRLRDLAVQKQVIGREEAMLLDPSQAIELIFRPGFSSRSEANSISGRGYGMDVVKTSITELSGMIDVSTTIGEGSRFRITLPTTLAVIQALVIESSGQTFCIPLSSVLESLMVHHSEIQTVEGHEVISVRGRTVPLLHLSRLFALDGRDPLASRHVDEHLYVIVVGLAQHRVGVVIDDLLGQQDVVIKPLGRALRQIPGLAGATELGDNRTVLLLDVATLIGRSGVRLDAGPRIAR